VTRMLPCRVSALAFTLALGAVPLAAAAPRLDRLALAQQQAQQPLRMASAQAHLQSLRTQLGLSTRESFVSRSAFTNSEGQAVVRLEQTFDGYRVWGGQAIAHVGTEGAITTQTQRVRTGINIQGEPLISADFAQQVVLAHLAPKGQMEQAPVVERVVFPAAFVGGLASKLDPATGRRVLDVRNTIIATPAAPYVWAYEVRTHLDNPQDGLKSLSYVIDGNTGKILRITNLILEAGAPSPVQGTGKGFYRGDVALNTSLMLDSSYTLFDQTHGTLPNPWLAGFSPDAATGWDPAIPGNQVWYNDGGLSYLFQGNTTNAWGDGQAYAGSDPGGPNGQSAGVDALSAITTTWDFYAKVFGRNGLDGQGTSVVAKVLDTGAYYIDNAAWDVVTGTATFGAGSYPGNPKGFQSMVDLDIVAHELTHAVTSPNSSHGLYAGGGYEEGGIAEALSDFFAQMVKIYAAREPGAPEDVIPEVEVEWQIGKNVGHGTPIRRMDKPSQDGVSYDGWYDGIRRLDSHHSSGPINRALYFLCQGASSTPGAVNYSPYLPSGMKGIGNDAAARIVYKAMTEYIVGDGTDQWRFEDLRAAAIAAAQHLFEPTRYADAVKNAFAAANIGDAVGQSARTKVLFSHWRNGDWIELDRPWQEFASMQILPRNEAVVPRVAVLNNANTAVTWSLGGPSVLDSGETPDAIAGGVINADGSWTTPNLAGWAAITATSQADPNQFAEGRAWLANMDTDMDLETDALDMAPIAFSWYLSRSLNVTASVIPAPWVEDVDVFFFVDGMKSTWPVK